MKNFPVPLKAVLIDFDGTLADSLPALRGCLHEFLGAYGIKSSEAEFLSLIGPSLYEIVERLRVKYALPGTVDHLYGEYCERVRQSYADKILPFADALDVLQRAKERGLKLAIVTSAPLSLIEVFLSRFKLHSFFDSLITPAKNEPSKPSPALYLRALETLGVSGTEALAIEDSAGGVASAYSTRLYVVQFGSSLPVQGAAIAVQRWEEIEEVLQGYQTHAITPSFYVEVVNSGEEIVLSDAEALRIDERWERAQEQRNGLLFNGKLLNYLKFEKERLYGSFVEYKYYMAQCIDPKLKERLRIFPLAISCICTCQDKVLIGKRSSFVTDFPGYFELVPSGGIDPAAVEKGNVNLVKQALTELKEEAGIEPNSVEICYPFVLFQNLITGCFEICLHIDLKRTGGDLSARAWLQNHEYTELVWMSCTHLKEFMLSAGNAIVPLSLHLINKYLSEIQKGKKCYFGPHR